MNFLLPLDLQLFSDDMGAADSGVESVPAAEEQTETGVESAAAAEPKENNFEKAFAKRLSAKEQEWQAKLQEVEGRYKDYEDLKQVADYFRELNEAPDIMTLKERIEMERLQERAAREGVPTEVQKRLETLEAKAAKADELEQQQMEQQRLITFEQEIKAFSEGKGIDHNELWNYMHENQLGNMEIAYKAMRADQLEKEFEEAKKTGVKEYLESKKAPRVEGSGAPGITSFKPTGNIEAASERALARIRAARQPS